MEGDGRVDSALGRAGVEAPRWASRGRASVLIVCLLVVGLFAGFALVGFHVARRAPDRYGMLLAVGLTTWIAGQAAINLGAVVGLLPVSGITLPYLSAGGSSLVFTMTAAGILASIARRSPTVPAAPAASAEHGARGS